MKLKRNETIGLVFFLALVITIGLVSLFEKDFDASRWKTNPLERHQMVDDIITSKQLIDKTKSDIILLLGQPDTILTNLERDAKDGFIYGLGTEPSFIKSKENKLLILFQNEKVVRVTEAED